MAGKLAATPIGSGTIDTTKGANMLKDYDELNNEFHGISKECALWNIARELSRRNDLLEIDMLCKTAEALKSAAKSSLGSLHSDGYIMAEELVCMAHKKICAITNMSEGLAKEGEKEDE